MHPSYLEDLKQIVKKELNEIVFKYQDFFSVEEVRELINKAVTEDCQRFLSTLDPIYHSEADTRGNLPLLRVLKNMNDIYFNNAMLGGTGETVLKLDMQALQFPSQEDRRFTQAEKDGFYRFIMDEADKHCLAAAQKPLENQSNRIPAPLRPDPDPWWRYELRLPADQQIEGLPLLYPSINFKNIARALPNKALGYGKDQYKAHLDFSRALLPGSLFLITTASLLDSSIMLYGLQQGVYVKLGDDISEKDGVELAEGMRAGVFLLMNSNHSCEKMQAIAKAIRPRNTLMFDKTMSKERVISVAGVLGKGSILKFAKDVPVDVVIAGVKALQPERFFCLGEMPEVASELNPGTGLTFEKDVSPALLGRAAALIKRGVVLFNPWFDVSQEPLMAGVSELRAGSGLVSCLINNKIAKPVARALSEGTFLEVFSPDFGLATEAEMSSILLMSTKAFVSNIQPKVVVTFSNDTHYIIRYAVLTCLPKDTVFYLKKTIDSADAINAVKCLPPGVFLFVEKEVLPVTLEQIKVSVKEGVQVQAEIESVSAALPRFFRAIPTGESKRKDSAHDHEKRFFKE